MLIIGVFTGTTSGGRSLGGARVPLRRPGAIIMPLDTQLSKLFGTVLGIVVGMPSA